MPMYAKFLKVIFPKNEKIDDHETFALGEKHGAMVLNKLSTKLKDLNSFSIPCLFRNVTIDNAL